MALRLLTPEEFERARTTRQRSILGKWMKALRLTKSELDEIRHVIGEEEYAKLIQAPAPEESGPVTYLHELKDYAEIYQRSPRQIKRWIRAGRNAKPPDLPPLDNRAEMLAWWNRMLVAEQLRQKPPAILEHYAIEAARDVAPAAAPGFAALDVSSLKVEEGIALQQAREFLAATAHQLKEAYASGQDAMIGRVQARWEKALGAVRLAEDSERRAAMSRGDLLPKHEVLSELSQVLEMIRNMQATMSRRIRAELGGNLPPEIDARLDAAIERQRARETAVLRRLKYFGSVEEIILELDQATSAAAA